MAYIYKDPNLQMLEAAKQELQDCEQQQKYLSKRIPELKDVIRTLNALLAKTQPQDVTDSLPYLCLRVLGLSQMPQSAQQIRDGLRLTGIELQGSNPLGILYTALARLQQSGLAEAITPFPGAPKHFRITTAGRMAMQK